MLPQQLFDFEPLDHCWRVGLYAAHAANLLSMGEGARKALRWAGILHDIGKLDVPKSILLKPGPLTEEETELLRRHPCHGSRRLAASGVPLRVQLAVLTHHERWDGSGYPFGLKGDEIPLAGRILAVCDSFDAMTSWRPYKEMMRFEQAVEEVRLEAGRLFDPQISDLFLKDLRSLRDVHEALGRVERRVVSSLASR